MSSRNVQSLTISYTAQPFWHLGCSGMPRNQSELLNYLLMAQQACERSVFLQHVRNKGSQTVFIRMKSHLPDSAILTTLDVCFVLLHPAGYLLALSSSADSALIETRAIDARFARQALKESNPLLQIDQVSIYKELILFNLSPKWIICPAYVEISLLSLPCRIYPVKNRR